MAKRVSKKKKAILDEVEDARYEGLTVAPEITPVYHGDIVKPDIEEYVAEDLITYFKEKEEGYADVPDFMIRDVYKLYFNQDESLLYDCKEHMFWWHEMLQNTNNYMLRTVTQNKPGYSFIACKHIIKLLQQEIEKNEELQQHLDNGSGGGGQNQKQQPSGGQGGGQPDLSQTNQNIQQQMQNIAQKASDEIDQKQQAEEAIGGGNLAGKSPSDIELLEERIEILKDVVLNGKEVSKFIKASIKGFKKGFGVRTIIKEESLFEADGIDDLVDEHYLFSELLAMDVNVRDKSQQQMTAFDLYIDVSGSMDNNMIIGSKAVPRIKTAISLAVRMGNMGCLGQIYAFNTSLKKLDEDSVWNLKTSGGTSIEICMQNIKKTGNPSVVLTDGEDDFETYTPHAFIMSVNPGGGSYYRESPEVAKMIRSRKFIEYANGKLQVPKI